MLFIIALALCTAQDNATSSTQSVSVSNTSSVPSVSSDSNTTNGDSNTTVVAGHVVFRVVNERVVAGSEQRAVDRQRVEEHGVVDPQQHGVVDTQRVAEHDVVAEPRVGVQSVIVTPHFGVRVNQRELCGSAVFGTVPLF